MEREARNWKWMLPAGGAVMCFVMARPFVGVARFEMVLGWPLVFLGLVCGVAALGNFVDYRRAQAIGMLERRQRAMSQTPLSAELESARGIHPEIVKVLINERHRVWMLKSGVQSQGVTPYAVLYGAPSVTDSFLQYFLQSSTDVTVMPKRLLSDGRKNRFDPWGAVSEYQMYDALVALLASQNKIHRWSEYSGWEWLSPWGPALVAADFGIEFDEVVVSEPEKAEL